MVSTFSVSYLFSFKCLPLARVQENSCLDKFHQFRSLTNAGCNQLGSLYVLIQLRKHLLRLDWGLEPQFLSSTIWMNQNNVRWRKYKDHIQLQDLKLMWKRKSNTRDIYGVIIQEQLCSWLTWTLTQGQIVKLLHQEN